MTLNILLAGFGGQGILFAGKQLAKSAMCSDLQVSWLPSYGPEMRGGAANCSVIISDVEIGSPLVVNPDLLIAMNIPSYDKFEPNVVKGGRVIYDSTLIPSPPKARASSIARSLPPALRLKTTSTAWQTSSSSAIF